MFIDNKISKAIFSFFIFYVGFIIYVTLLNRSWQEDHYIITEIGRNYIYVKNGAKEVLLEIVCNWALFVPLGVLFPFLSNSYYYFKTLLMGSLLSIFIELTQYLLHRGVCDINDVFHNILGCLSGIFIYLIITNLLRNNNTDLKE